MLTPSPPPRPSPHRYVSALLFCIALYSLLASTLVPRSSAPACAAALAACCLLRAIPTAVFAASPASFCDSNVHSCLGGFTVNSWFNFAPVQAPSFFAGVHAPPRGRRARPDVQPRCNRRPTCRDAHESRLRTV